MNRDLQARFDRIEQKQIEILARLECVEKQQLEIMKKLRLGRYRWFVQIFEKLPPVLRIRNHFIEPHEHHIQRNGRKSKGPYG